jgi:feruloyl esterase
MRVTAHLKTSGRGLAVVLVMGLWPLAASAQPLSCPALASLQLPQTTIVRAHVVEEAAYTGVAPLGLATGATVPMHCEVVGRIAPTEDSDIRFIVWLPVAGWNGKYRQEGNSGLAGLVPVWNLIDPLRRGYATAATDDGHDDPTGAEGASFAIGHPEKLIDFPRHS